MSTKEQKQYQDTNESHKKHEDHQSEVCPNCLEPTSSNNKVVVLTMQR